MMINDKAENQLPLLGDCSVDIIFTDPPYALGSEVIIRSDGKPDYRKAVDFMDKWQQPDGAFWEEWFRQAYRILKHGGRIIMFGMDRQLMLNKYYACAAGFIEQQSIYWYFISNFPKSSDLSKNIDKNAGAERTEIIGKYKLPNGQKWNLKQSENSEIEHKSGNFTASGTRTLDITAPQTILAKKYDGYKYSVSPLKQTNETIMIFQKPYKTGSCLHDTLAYENGDKTCLCGALDINGNRVNFVSDADKKESTDKNQHKDFGTPPMTNNVIYGDYSMVQPKNYDATGRYPSQTFVDSEAAKILDGQSGINSSCKSKETHSVYGDDCKFGGGISSPDNQYDDTGGCSKILHKCDYDNGDYDLYYYCPKVSADERKYLKKFDCSDIVLYLCDEFENIDICETNIIREAKKVTLSEIMEVFQKKDIEEFGIQQKKDLKWSIGLFGKQIMEIFQKENLFTTSTETNLTIISKIYSLLTQYFIKECTADVNLKMTDGGNLAISVGENYMNQISTKINTDGLCRNVKSAELKLLLSINENANKKIPSTHPTVKPLELCIKVLGLFKTPNPQVVLDTFAGSGTTGMVCEKLGMDYILIEQDKDFCEIGDLRIAWYKEYLKNEIAILHLPKTPAEPFIKNQLDLFD